MTISFPPRRKRPGALWWLGLPALGVALTIAAWQAVIWIFAIRPRFLPSPWQTGVAVRDNASHLFDQTMLTIGEILAGFALGAVAGLVCAAMLAASPSLEQATLPLVVALNALPKVALAPLLTIWLGTRYQPHIALAAVICFFPILIAALAGLTSTPAELIELARSLDAPRWQAFFKIKLPWAMPQVFAGLKLGMTLAVIGTVVGQLVRPSDGLGAVILFAGQSEDTTLAFAAIVPLMAISMVLFYAVVAVETRLLRWTRATTTTAPDMASEHPL